MGEHVYIVEREWPPSGYGDQGSKELCSVHRTIEGACATCANEGLWPLWATTGQEARWSNGNYYVTITKRTVEP